MNIDRELLFKDQVYQIAGAAIEVLNGVGPQICNAYLFVSTRVHSWFLFR